MLFDIITIFPELFFSPLREGILRRAAEQGEISVNLHNVREYATDKHHMTDDRPFGGGEGMVMKPEPLSECLKAVQGNGEPGKVILLSPRGTTYSQQTAQRLSACKRLVLVCGRYEGVDERFRELYVDEELSIGDYILTGGELAAMVVVDSVTRLLPGVLGCADSAQKDTFSRGLLKHSQYTRPRVFEGREVPEILLSGDHAAIARYRFLESIRETLQRRPALIAGMTFTAEEIKILRKADLLVSVEQAIRDHGNRANTAA